MLDRRAGIQGGDYRVLALPMIGQDQSGRKGGSDGQEERNTARVTRMVNDFMVEL
jgi:hypothetical protein